MTETEFKKQFITQFITMWVANNFNDACMRGQHDKLFTPPTEDARFLADKAWEHMKDTILEQGDYGAWELKNEK